MKAAISISPTTPARHLFTSAIYAAVMSFSHRRDAGEFLRGQEQASLILLDRSAVLAGTTTDGDFGSKVIRNAFRDFLSNIEPYSAASRLIAAGVDAALSSHGQALYPQRASGAPTVNWVAELDPIPVDGGLLQQITLGPAKKFATIMILSREVTKRPDAQSVINTLLRESIGATLDAAYLSTAAGSDAAHAGLLNGLSPLEPTASPVFDLEELSAAVAAGGSGDVIFVMNPARLARLRVRHPELTRTLNIAPSAAVPEDRIIAADPRSIIHGIDQAPEIDVSREAVIHMSDDPNEIVSATGPTVADPVRSLWQTDSVGVRIIAEVAFAKRRAGAVAYMDEVLWT